MDLGLKRNKQKSNFQYAATSMMTLQILKYVDFPETQKSRYLDNETLFFLFFKEKKLITRQGLLSDGFVAEVTF